MINLKKIILPSSVMVEGVFYKIKTDYQYFLIFADLLSKPTLLRDFDFMYVSDIPENRQAGIDAIYDFAYPKKEIPRRTEKSTVRLLDFNLDADYIYAAFMEKYHIDLLNPDLHLHWYKFNALLNALGECKLTEIIGYRAYKPNKKSDFKKDMLENQRAWSLPIVLTAEETAFLNEFDSLFK